MNRERVRRRAAAATVVACLLSALLAAAAPSRAADSEPPPGVGGSAPPFELADVGGTARKIAWGADGPPATIVYFFDPQSSDCLLEMSFLDTLYARARDFGLAVVAVEAKGRQPAEVSRSLERYCALYRDPSFPVLPDPAYSVNRRYGVRQAPVTFLTESHGVILNRIEGYEHAAAVAIARRVEQLLRRERGFFSEALRGAGISEAEERDLETRLAATASAGEGGRAQRALSAGDRVPAFEFTDLAGRSGLWSWSAQGGAVRLLLLWGGGSLPSVEALTWLDGLARRGRDVGLEALAVEASGLDAGAVQAAVEKFRRYNPAPSFRVVADPGGSVTRIFAPGDLPHTYLIGGDGAILHHAEGFDRAEASVVAGKVEKAFVLAGRPFPPERGGTEASPVPSTAEEAPSIRTARDREERYRSSVVQGDAYFMTWEFERALPHYLAALEVQPKDPHALRRTALIYERRGEPERALGYWERLVAVRPEDEEARSHLKSLRPAP